MSKKLKLSDDVEARIDDIASRTEGYSGADLQAVVYNAHLEAIHDVLGDRSSEPTKNQSADRASKDATSKSFIQFLYDSSEHDAAISSRGIRSSALTPPAVVAAKLEAMKQARRRQRQLEHGAGGAADSAAQPVTNGTNGIHDDDDARDEVVIRWEHVERSLSTTRCSLSEAERRRLDAIYDEFAVGRNGEMPNGEGAREIGGRTSLM